MTNAKSKQLEIARVCIIEDNKMDQYLVTRSTTHLVPGIITKTFSTAEGFIEYLDNLIEDQKSEELCDTLVTMDLRMPGMGGLRALEEIQARIDEKILSPDSFPCFVLTSSNSLQDRIDIEKFAFVKKYIIKPITIDKIEDIIKESTRHKSQATSHNTSQE